MIRLVFFSSIILFGFNTCQAFTHSLSGPLDAAQALTNPNNVGAGTGLISGNYDDLSNTLNYSIQWMDLTADVTNMHFHLGAPGVSGGVELAVPGPWASPQVGTDILLSNEQESNLLAGDWYLNIHTSAFGGGEIRGQVAVTPVPEPNNLVATSLVTLFSVALLRRRRSQS